MGTKMINSLKMVSIYLSEPAWEEVRVIAHYEGVSASSLARKWINDRLRSRRDLAKRKARESSED